MQSNNGILVVDDLGRQVIRPDELLNRWIVPLSRGIDFLRLLNGAKFTVPFELKLVTSTNLDPNSLGDDAFLRRLRNKVFVGPITETAFNWILVRTAQARQIEVTAESAQHLRRVCNHFLGELRPYVAVDFCELMLGICRYEGMAPVLEIPMINRVAGVYFVSDGSKAPLEPTSQMHPATQPMAQATPRPQQPAAAPPVGLQHLAGAVGSHGQPGVGWPQEPGRLRSASTYALAW
ncbi:MAG: hypothetical protein O3C27_08165 [Actinomycetota bacterium]|nr:hypothetical protein [Actinomycetota bacterium]